MMDEFSLGFLSVLVMVLCHLGYGKVDCRMETGNCCSVISAGTCSEVRLMAHLM